MSSLITPDTPITITLPAGVWPLLRAGLDYLPAPRVQTDPAIAEIEREYSRAVAALAPAEADAAQMPDETPAGPGPA